LEVSLAIVASAPSSRT